MISSYVLLYQFFENEEIKIVQQIENLQTRTLYRDCRKFTTEETHELYVLKIQLDLVRNLAKKILGLFYEM